MDEYKVYLKKSAAKEIELLPKKDIARLLARIDALRHDPRPHGSERLAGMELYRVRQGCYRIVYSIEDSILTVWVVKVGLHPTRAAHGFVAEAAADVLMK